MLWKPTSIGSSLGFSKEHLDIIIEKIIKELSEQHIILFFFFFEKKHHPLSPLNPNPFEYG